LVPLAPEALEALEALGRAPAPHAVEELAPLALRAAGLGLALPGHWPLSQVMAINHRKLWELFFF